MSKRKLIFENPTQKKLEIVLIKKPLFQHYLYLPNIPISPICPTERQIFKERCENSVSH